MRDVKDDQKKLMDICKNRIKTMEQEKEVWKVDTAASLAVKQLHAKELFELEKPKVKEKNIDLNRLCNEKALIEKTLGTKCTSKDGLPKQLRSLKERSAKRKTGKTDPMENNTVRSDAVEYSTAGAPIAIGYER